MISRKTITRWLLITASTDWGSRPYRPGYTRTHTHKRQPLPQRTYNLNKQNKGNDESKKQRGGITCVRTQDSFGLASCLSLRAEIPTLLQYSHHHGLIFLSCSLQCKIHSSTFIIDIRSHRQRSTSLTIISQYLCCVQQNYNPEIQKY